MVVPLSVTLVALAGSLLVGPLTSRLGRHLRVMDWPKPLCIHSTPTPRTGGLAVLVGFLLAVGAAMVLVPGLSPGDKTTLFGLSTAAVLVALIGLLDDRGTIPTKVEVSTLLLPALLLVLSGIRVQSMPIIYFSIALTLFYIIGGCSAMNLIDGMDGLAGRVAPIAAAFFAMLSLSRGEAVAARASSIVRTVHEPFCVPERVARPPR